MYRYERAESMGCITEDLARKHVSLHLQLRQLDEARKLAAKLCSGKLAESVQLWGLRITIEIRCITKSSSSPSDSDLQSLFELLRQILTKAPVSKSENLWLQGLKLYADHKQYFDKLVEISIVSLARGGGSESGFSLSSAIVGFILQKMEFSRPGISINALEKLLKEHTGKYAIGDEVSLADIFLAPQLYSAYTRFNIHKNEFPILSRLHETYYEIPAFREALPENQPDATL